MRETECETTAPHCTGCGSTSWESTQGAYSTCCNEPVALTTCSYEH